MATKLFNIFSVFSKVALRHLIFYYYLHISVECFLFNSTKISPRIDTDSEIRSQ